jgi:hypothetical protein
MLLVSNLLPCLAAAATVERHPSGGVCMRTVLHAAAD